MQCLRQVCRDMFAVTHRDHSGATFHREIESVLANDSDMGKADCYGPGAVVAIRQQQKALNYIVVADSKIAA